MINASRPWLPKITVVETGFLISQEPAVPENAPRWAPIVRTQFVTNRNSVGFARKKAQTISFVERGFERLGLSHQAVGFSWCSYMDKSFSP